MSGPDTGEIATDDTERDELSELVAAEGIRAVCVRIDVRPDVDLEEQSAWIRQDPEFPPEHYRCLLTMGNRELQVYQTVGADFPDEEADTGIHDLYEENRQVMLSAEYLLETAALKADSVDNAADLEEWTDFCFCETTTPEATYDQYVKLRTGLQDLLGAELYRKVVQLAVAAELERDEESEESF